MEKSTMIEEFCERHDAMEEKLRDKKRDMDMEVARKSRSWKDSS